MRALVTGATGLIGSALTAKLPGAVALSRDPARAAERLGSVEVRRWDPQAESLPGDVLRDIDVVFNLAGESVGARWTPERKKRIHDSRVIGTRNLVAGIRSASSRPKVLISASAVGYYGDRGGEDLDETSSAGKGFLAEVCVDWEREAMAAEALGVRVVCVRTGVVLSPSGGALERMLTPFKMGVGGRLGSGQQWMSWIHIDDLASLMVHASKTDSVRGPLNGVAPLPVTNADFTRALGGALRRPTLLAVPKVALRLAFGEMSEVLLASQKVHPRVAEQSGYAFAYSDLDRALAAVLTKAPGEAAYAAR